MDNQLKLNPYICIYCGKPCPDSWTSYIHYACAVKRYTEIKKNKEDQKEKHNKTTSQ